MKPKLCFPPLLMAGPAVALAASFCLVTAVLFSFPRFALVLCVVFCAVLVLATSFLLKEEEKKRILCLVALGFAAALILFAVMGFKTERFHAQVGTKEEISATVVGKEAEEIHLRPSLFSPVSGKIRVKNTEDFSVGDRLIGTLFVTSVTTSEERGDGVFLEGEWERAERRGKDAVLAFFDSLRTRWSERLPQTDTGAFYRAVLLGKTEALTDSQKEAFRRVGASHLLAVSGLHFSQLLGGAYLALNLLPLGRKVRSTALILISLGFMVLTGWSVSVCRAGIMMISALSARFVRRRGDSLVSLVWAATLLILWNPYCVTTLSFLFSFLSTFSVLAVSLPLSLSLMREMGRGRRGFFSFAGKAAVFFLSSFLVSACAFPFTLPVQLSSWGEVQVLSPLYGLILVPLFTPCLFLALLTALIGGEAMGAATAFSDFFLSLTAALSRRALPLLELEHEILLGAVLATTLYLLWLVLGQKPVFRVLWLYLSFLALAVLRLLSTV